MKKNIILLMFVSLISFGQNESNQVSWTSSELDRCVKDMLADLESDIEGLKLLSIFGNSKESFAECACDSLKKRYDSYDLASTDFENIDECQAMSLILPCFIGFDFKKINEECVLGNCFCGFGKQVFANGEIYEGYFKMFLFHGNGMYLYKNGSKYEGEFNENHKHGSGSYFFLDGGVYTGEWKNDVFYGKGLRTWTNGETYYGDWKDGYKHGIGTYTYENGAVHTGQYENDLPHGSGEYTFSDVKLTGYWVNGKKHGKFIFHVIGLKDKKVKYRNGEKVK